MKRFLSLLLAAIIAITNFATPLTVHAENNIWLGAEFYHSGSNERIYSHSVYIPSSDFAENGNSGRGQSPVSYSAKVYEKNNTSFTGATVTLELYEGTDIQISPKIVTDNHPSVEWNAASAELRAKPGATAGQEFTLVAKIVYEGVPIMDAITITTIDKPNLDGMFAGIPLTGTITKNAIDGTFEVKLKADATLGGRKGIAIFESSNPEVATVVDQGGVATITIHKVGETNITVTGIEDDTQAKDTDSFKLVVEKADQPLEFENQLLILQVGESAINPLSGAMGEEVTFHLVHGEEASSSNDIAEVDSAGRVTAKSVGDVEVFVNSTETDIYNHAIATYSLLVVDDTMPHDAIPITPSSDGRVTLTVTTEAIDLGNIYAIRVGKTMLYTKQVDGEYLLYTKLYGEGMLAGKLINGSVKVELYADFLNTLPNGANHAVVAYGEKMDSGIIINFQTTPVYIHLPAPSSGSNSSSDYYTTQTDLSNDVKQYIEDANSGDHLTVNMEYYTTLPASIMELLRTQNVGLTIQWDGGADIEIPAGTALSAESGRVHWTLSDLAELYSEITTTTPSTTAPTTTPTDDDKYNPGTGAKL